MYRAKQKFSKQIEIYVKFIRTILCYIYREKARKNFHVA